MAKFLAELLIEASSSGGALWARIAQNVKKPSLTVNDIDFEFLGFLCIHMGPLKSLWSQKVIIHW